MEKEEPTWFNGGLIVNWRVSLGMCARGGFGQGAEFAVHLQNLQYFDSISANHWMPLCSLDSDFDHIVMSKDTISH